MMTFYDKILVQCSKKGISPSGLSTKIGISQAAVSKWKKGSLPHNSTLKAISDYFGVPTTYFTDSEQIIPAHIVSAKKEASSMEENAVQVDDFIVYNVPVYEDIAAGFGSQAEDRIVDYQPMPFRNKSEAEEMVMFHVVGDSMMPKIESGDYILVKKQTSVDSGDLAAVLLDEELGLIKKGEYGSDYVSLISLNPAYPPRVFAGKDVTRLRILGKVKKIISEP